ncbi:MAG TPA: hypothetical protein VFX25_27660 [Streptosporangiaceae bacterium]|nr:hypothetical protein [Streptosporangiaceae bacterium]
MSTAVTWPDDGAQPEVPLLGGDVTEGVVRVGDTVRRPLNPNSALIHALLRHLEAAGFRGAPRFLGIDAAGRAVLSYIEGEVAGRPPPPWIGDEDRMTSVARLVRAYGDGWTCCAGAGCWPTRTACPAGTGTGSSRWPSCARAGRGT